MRFGAHIAIARGPSKAVAAASERGCDAVQGFSSNPRAWALSRADPVQDGELRAAFEGAGIGPVVLHTPYLLNIASADGDVYTRSVATLVHAADRARRLDGYAVVHAGRDQTGPRDPAVARAAAAVLTCLKLVPDGRVLVEPTSGGKGSVASRLDEIDELLDAIDDERVGLCLDTCHVHVAGHDLSSAALARRFLAEADKRFGLSRVAVLHANDARDACGSARDRHWHLGQGTIGESGLGTILSDRRLAHATVICETPGSAADDRDNIAKARLLAGGRNAP